MPRTRRRARWNGIRGLCGVDCGTVGCPISCAALELRLPWSDDSTFVAQLDCGPAPASADGKTPPDEHTVAIVVRADDCSVRIDDRAPVSWRKGEPFPWSVNGSGEGERALSLVAVDASTRLWIDDVQLKCLARSRAR